MICLVCHILVGASYRTRLMISYRADVCRPVLPPLGLYANTFNTGLFDCFQGEGVLKRNFIACCCAPVYYAVDAAATDFMGFWLALILTSIFIPIIWVFGYITRLHIRRLFKMDRAVLLDFCSWFFCCTCALIQEHRFILRAFQAFKENKSDFEITPDIQQAKTVTSRPQSTEPPPTPATSSQTNGQSPVIV